MFFARKMPSAPHMKWRVQVISYPVESSVRHPVYSLARFYTSCTFSWLTYNLAELSTGRLAELSTG